MFSLNDLSFWSLVIIKVFRPPKSVVLPTLKLFFLNYSIYKALCLLICQQNLAMNESNLSTCPNLNYTKDIVVKYWDAGRKMM